jgi:hypothetical protein
VRYGLWSGVWEDPLNEETALNKESEEKVCHLCNLSKPFAISAPFGEHGTMRAYCKECLEKEFPKNKQPSGLWLIYIRDDQSREQFIFDPEEKKGHYRAYLLQIPCSYGIWGARWSGTHLPAQFRWRIDYQKKYQSLEHFKTKMSEAALGISRELFEAEAVMWALSKSRKKEKK